MPLPKPRHTPLASITARYRPFASLLLKDPVQHFRQAFDTMADFNAAIGDEARSGVEATAGEYEFTGTGEEAAGAGEERAPEFYETREDLPPEFYEQQALKETVPSSRVLSGEGGMVVGPHAAEGRGMLGVGKGALNANIPLQDHEVGSIVEDFQDEAKGRTGFGMEDWAQGIMDAFKANDMSPRQRAALLGLKKSAEGFLDAVEERNEGLKPEQRTFMTEAGAWQAVLEDYERWIKDQQERGLTNEATIQQALGKYAPESLERRQEALRASQAAPPESPTAREVTGPQFVGPTGKRGLSARERLIRPMRPEVPVPEAQPAAPSAANVPQRTLAELNKETGTPFPEEGGISGWPIPKEKPGKPYALGGGPPIEPFKQPSGQGRIVQYTKAGGKERKRIEYPQMPSRAKAEVEESAKRKSRALAGAATRHSTKEEIYALREGLEDDMREQGHLAGREVYLESFAKVEGGKKPTKEQSERADKIRQSLHAVIATGEITTRKGAKKQSIPPMRQVDEALRYADMLLKKSDAASQFAGKTLRAAANKLKKAGKDIIPPEDIAAAEEHFKEQKIWSPNKAGLDELIAKAQRGYDKGAQLAAKKDPRDKRIGKQWMKEAQALAEDASFVKANWGTSDLHAAVVASRTELNEEFKRARSEGAKYPDRLNYFPGRWEAELWNDNTIAFGGLRFLGKNFRRPKAFANAYDAIENGPYIRVNKDAADMVEHRVRQGRMAAINGKWAETLKGIKDPESGQPILVDPEINPIDKRPQAPEGGRDHDLIDIGNSKYAVLKEYRRVVETASELKSDFAESAVGNAALTLTRRMKHEAILIFDSFHPGRLVHYTLALNGNLEWKGPWSALEYRPESMAKAVDRGLISQSQMKWATEPVSMMAGGTELKTNRREILMEGLRSGLNIAKLQDSLYAEMKHFIPGVSAMNKFVFGKITRGFMGEAFVGNLLKYNKAHPDLPLKTLMRDVVKDTNLFYGSIGRQGAFKHAWMRDLSEMLFLAPSWVEGLVQKEARFASRATGLSYALGRRELPFMGTLGSGMGKGLATFLALTQAINLITRRQTTFQNKEKGHKFDAWIPGPGENGGFWFSPMSVFAEVTHDFLRLAQTKPKASDAIRQVGYNKLSPWGRMGMVFATGETPTGERIPTSAGVGKEMAMQAVPVPITLSSLLRYPAHAMFPKTVRPVQAGRAYQQFAASGLGLKIQPGESNYQQISRLADHFMRDNKFRVDTVQVVPTTEASYSKLWTAIRVGDELGAAAFLKELRARRTDADDLLFQAAEARADRPFTGSDDHEFEFQQSLTPEEMKMYHEAEQDRMVQLQKFYSFWSKYAKKP